VPGWAAGGQQELPRGTANRLTDTASSLVSSGSFVDLVAPADILPALTGLPYPINTSTADVVAGDRLPGRLLFGFDEGSRLHAADIERCRRDLQAHSPGARGEGRAMNSKLTPAVALGAFWQLPLTVYGKS
jgi:hypothetical protein